jgi:uncharacterized protein DUF4404
MSTEQLHALLRGLHAELARTASLDAEARRLIGVVVSDLEKLGAAISAPHPTPGALKALAVRFEADHPAMGAALRQVADLLGKAGI